MKFRKNPICCTVTEGHYGVERGLFQTGDNAEGVLRFQGGVRLSRLVLLLSKL
jgi:hypothetical protein